ncbi:Nlrc3 [Symbiodinium sp. CCMP2456]|nr:Nlrc3 [Symbiodinium sp. CCMP2456]
MDCNLQTNLTGPEIKYDLRKRGDLASFLQNADIRLVRARYLYMLCSSRKALPRRQEAELVESMGGDATDGPALVTHGEMSEYGAGNRMAIIFAVSHSWETREHPDPCCFQLEQIVNCLSLYEAAYETDLWVFYDYVSLFQYQRKGEREEQSFRRALDDMHVIYAHEFTCTLRIESLTPEATWTAALADPSIQVSVYDEPSDSVRLRPLRDLVQNRSPYRDRGWCKAEIEWSALKSSTAMNHRIDQAEAEASTLRSMPMTPEALRSSAVFTHRSDAASVVQLQAKIFHQKVSACEDLLLEGLKASEFAQLAPALKHYRCLRSLRLKKFNVGAEEATAFAQALLGPGGVVQKLEIWCNVPEESAREMLKALATGLQTNSTVHTLIIREGDIGPAGGQALAEAIKANSTIQTMIFTESLGTTSVRALSQGLRVNAAITKLVIRNKEFSRHKGIGNAGAEAIATALMTNQSITHVDLGNNGIGLHGAKAIAEALKHNSTVAIMDLVNNHMKGQEGACALADGLKNNHVVIDLDIHCNWWELSDEPRALSEIERLLERNQRENSVAARPGWTDTRRSDRRAADARTAEREASGRFEDQQLPLRA